ncbi:hypothetical protein [Miltoncostaea marina]|uniref:hypothetical protein n=1 Tax=Miltoncostaea marina TaxID=2843215 RepID=UPI001C3D8924|nr:hypothetical protein [Miltoncostaea marina]
MSHSATPRRPRRGQRGASLITVITLTAVLALLVLASLSLARSGTTQTARESRADIALQAADAGVNTYISRLVEDRLYYLHYVDRAEDPRVAPNGVVHQPGSAWNPAYTTWTYQAGASRTWVKLQDSRYGEAAYSLRIVPPAAGSPDLVTVQSTAQAGRGRPSPVTRSVQAQVRPSSIADFQMISNATIRYGDNARTTGKLYSAVDINHQGIAEAAAYAQRYVCSTSSNCSGSYRPSSVYRGGAYDSTTTPSFRSRFPTPIDFNRFTQTRLDIRAAAEATGTYFNNSGANAWLVQFLGDGRARVWRVTNTSDPGATISRLECEPTKTLGAQTAMYFEQSVIVSDGLGIQDVCRATSGARHSVVKGNVTIASKGNVYVGGNISYAADGNNVLGLIAANEVVIAEYAPVYLTFRAATLAQSGQWRTYRSQPRSTNPHREMVYIGSQTTADGGYATQFQEREYRYDETLQRLRPYLYPVIEGSWETYYWREVLPPS